MADFQFARRLFLVVQDAVDAVADAELFFERLDVNIAGALFDGGGDHGVDQTDDRRFAGHVAQMFEVFAGGAVVDEIAGFGFRGLAVILVDGVEDFALAGDGGNDFETGDGLDGGDGFKVQRIGHGEVDGGAFDGHGKADELAEEADRERLGFGRERGRAVDFDEGDAQLFAERAEHVAHGDEAEIDENFAQLLVAFFLQLEGAVEVVLGDEFARDECLAEAH